jgi:hypothetical protein
MKFQSSIKIYFLKETEEITLSIKVTDSFVNTYKFTKEQFEKIINEWDQQGGILFKTNNGSWMFQHKKRGPRPLCESANYVRIDYWKGEQSFHYRVDYSDMINMCKDYYYQKNHKMYWDKE